MALRNGYIAILLLVAGVAHSQELKLSADTSSMKIGEHLELVLEIEDASTLSNSMWEWPVINDSLPGGWEVLSKTPLDSSATTLRQTFKITRWDTGYFVIPPIRMAKDYEWVESNPVLVSVSFPEQVSESEIRDIKEIREVSYTLWDRIKDNALAILIVILVAAGLSFMIWRLSKQKKQKKETVEKKIAAPKIPAHIVALQELSKLEEARLWQQGKVKEYHIQLSDILRRYLENRYRISAMEKTSREIILELRTMGIQADELQRLRASFDVSDMAKFAKYKPEETENEAVMRNIREFIEQTAEVVQTQS